MRCFDDEVCEPGEYETLLVIPKVMKVFTGKGWDGIIITRVSTFTERFHEKRDMRYEI